MSDGSFEVINIASDEDEDVGQGQKGGNWSQEGNTKQAIRSGENSHTCIPVIKENSGFREYPEKDDKK